MPLNIIVKSSPPVRWEKVVEVKHQRENARRDWYNRIGLQRLHAHSDAIARRIEQNGHRDVLVFDRTFDGLMMDQCRQLNGTTDWKHHKDYLRWVLKQPEQAGISQHQKRQLEQLISEAGEHTPPPAYERDKSVQAQRRSDFAKLPKHMQRGLTP
jgi:hypothetical protein